MIFFFKKEKQKPLFEDYFLFPKLGEADPGGLGACPQKSINYSVYR
jgi:hypothetical protein